MSITASFAPPGSATALWRRLIAAVLATARLRRRRGGDAPCRHTRHDIGLDRMHQGYAPRGRSARASVRQLHARAERLAAGLPD